MPNVFDTSSLEGKIILLLVEVYPCTMEDISTYLGAPKGKVKKSVNLLAKKGIVALEPLPDMTYVKLVSGDFSFKGRETEQLKRVQEKMKKRSEWHTPDDEDNPMYG